MDFTEDSYPWVGFEAGQRLEVAEPFHEGNGRGYVEAQRAALRRLEGIGYRAWLVSGGPNYIGEAGPKGRKSPRGVRGAKGWNDAANAFTLDDALKQVERGRAGCVGVLVGAGAGPAGHVVVDVDGVVQDGVLLPVGAEALRQFGAAYCETSPSSTGLRFVCRAELAGIVKGEWGDGEHRSLEAFPAGGSAKFARMTGAAVLGCGGDPDADCQSGVDWLLRTIGRTDRGSTVGCGAVPKSADVGGRSVGDAPGSARVSPDNVKGEAPAPGTDLKVSPERNPDNVSEPAHVKHLSIDAVFAELAGLRPELDPAEVLAAMQQRAADKPRGKLAQALAGKYGPWQGDRSSVDRAVACEAVRRGAGSVDGVVEVWGATAPARREKFTERADYRLRTVDGAARAVLVELRKRAASGVVVGGAGAAVPESVAVAVEAAQRCGGLVLDRRGLPVPTVGNVLALLRVHPDAVGAVVFNELTQSVQRARSWRSFDQGASDEPGRLADDDITRVCAWLNREMRMSVRREEVRAAVYAVARERSFDPLKDRLHELHAAWIEAGRPALVEGWLQRFALVEDAGIAEFVNTAGACFLVGAVARAMQPGVKADSVLCLEGTPGAGKSSLFAALADAVLPGLFTDSLADASDTARIVEGTRGKWIVELAELAAVRRAADVEALKASLTRQVEVYRMPYGTEPAEVPRRFVFGATTNNDGGGYLADEALLRRFWTVKTMASEAAPMPLDELRQAAPLLWGEAVDLYLSGRHWWITEQDGAAFQQWREARGERLEEGAFFDELIQVLAEWAGTEPETARPLRVIAERVGDEKSAAGHMPAQRALSQTLQRHGLEQKRTKAGRFWQFTPASANRFAGIAEAGRRGAGPGLRLA